MLTLTSAHSTWAHRLPAGAKLVVLAAVTAGLFALYALVPMGLAACGVLAVVASGGRGFARESLAMLRPVWPFAVIVGLWHALTWDLQAGLVILLRMGAALMAANFVTMTTRLSDMLAVIERAFAPLAVFGLRPRALALALALVLRFIPVMVQRFGAIGLAFRARGSARPGWRLLMPTTLAALDDADHVADALRARGGAG